MAIEAPLGAHEVSAGPADGGNDQSNWLKKFRRYVTLGVANAKKLSKWIERGDTMFKGNKKPADETNDQIHVTRVNKVRRKIVASVSQIYSRNPKFTAKAKRPILVPADPVPMMVQDPLTGAMVQQIGPDGMPAMTTPIDPETGEPATKDISDEICDVVTAIMDNIFFESGFKGEAKACCLEAHHRPASVMQIGYEYDPDNEIDDIYFRWRSFKKFIIDPEAQIYNGVLRKCRFMGVRWSLREAEAKAMGLEWSSMIDSKDPNKYSGTDDDECREVFQVWSQELGLVAWISENAPRFAREPEEWPWKVDGYPFVILKLTEDTDEQFSKPLILEAEGIQKEMDDMRETMENKIVENRTITLFDSKVISESDMAEVAGRRRNGYKGIEGLSTLARPPIETFNEDKLDAEFYAHYERNEREMDSVLGTSANEQAQMVGKTAREVEEVSKNQGVMTSAKVDINADFINNAARKAVQIMRQTYTEERVTKITTKDGSRYWVKWIGSDVLAEVDLSIDVGSIQKEDDDVRKQVALNMFNTLKDIPGIKVKKLANDILREHGRKETEEYWDADSMAQPAQTGAPQPPAPGQQPTDVRASLAGQTSPMV